MIATTLVTGGAGFIGSHLCQALLDRGHRVVVLDSFDDFYPRAYKELNLAAVRKHAADGAFTLREIDITDTSAMARTFAEEKPRYVIHLAANAGVRPSIERPAKYASVNVVGTTNVLQESVKHGVERVVLASSSSVYGNGPVPFREDARVDEPISPYAATKRACELVAHTFWHVHKLPVFCVRPFTVFGPRQRPDLAIHKFTRLIIDGKPLPFFGDGSTSRDYTFVTDIVAGLLTALDRCDRFRIYNLGGSHPITLKQLIEELEKAIGKPALLDRQPAQAGDVERTYADLTRVRTELAWEPKVSIPEGLKRFVEWYRGDGQAYRSAVGH